MNTGYNASSILAVRKYIFWSIYMENTTLDNIVSIEAFRQLDKMRNTAEHVSQSFAAKEKIPLNGKSRNPTGFRRWDEWR